MELKQRLQRVLQILEDSERIGAMSDLEKDMVLADLREAYSEVKFGVALDESRETRAESVAPVLPTHTQEPEPTSEPEIEDTETENDEPEMEFEIIFNEEDDEEETEVEDEELRVESEIETETEIEIPEVETEVVEELAVEEPMVEEPVVQPISEPISQEKTVVEQIPSEYNFQRSTPARSAILSLYEDAAPIVGEQFREQPSVADVIACPKGVAESTPIYSLRESIGVADKFMLIRELFDGDIESYDAAIDALEGIATFEDCVIFITENFTWRAQSEGTKFMMELLQRKYNA